MIEVNFRKWSCLKIIRFPNDYLLMKDIICAFTTAVDKTKK